MLAYHSRPILPKEALHISTSHKLQQNEARQGLEADPNAPHNILVAELAANQTPHRRMAERREN